jgi:hypothetical protein
MVRPRRPPGRGWVYDPARAFRQSKAPVPTDIQREVQHRVQELIDSALKPRHIQPPPKKAEFNYLVDTTPNGEVPFFTSVQGTVRRGPVPFHPSSNQSLPDFSTLAMGALTWPISATRASGGKSPNSCLWKNASRGLKRATFSHLKHSILWDD